MLYKDVAVNYLCDHYFETKEDINSVLSFLNQKKPDEWGKMSAADEKIFELFETELFVLSHLDDKNLNAKDLEVLCEFVKFPQYHHEFERAFHANLNELHQAHNLFGRVFEFELLVFEQKLNDIAMMFSKLDNLLNKKIQAKRRFHH